MLCLFAVFSESALRKAEGTGPNGRNGLIFASLTWKVRGLLYKILAAESRGGGSGTGGGGGGSGDASGARGSARGARGGARGQGRGGGGGTGGAQGSVA